MPDDSKAVFLSYASQDAEAAQRICDALRAAGAEVWFDRNELVGGDAWDAKIRKQIAECVLFVPIISAHTQARTEGYFRLEWKLAAQRTHMIADDAAFLLPLVIDDTRDAEARVPAEFKAVQWTRIGSAGSLAAFGERVKTLLRGSAGGSPARRDEPPSPSGFDVPRGVAVPTHQRPPAVLRVPVVAWGLAAVASIAVVLTVLVMRKPASSLASAPTAAQPPSDVSAASSAKGSATAEGSAKADKSVVVLPLENLSPDPENAFFADGMHAEIIATLQRILPELKVVSRPTAVAFTNAKLSVADFARKIGVANVITGSVRRAGERLRVQLELRRAHDDALLWASPKPERSLKDQFDIQSEIAEEVARVLQVRERRGSWAGAQFMTRNQEAYDLFLKAGATLEKSWLVGDEDRLRQARAVVELDPAFMPGVSHLSTTYAGLYRNARNPAERVAHAAEAKRWGEKASQMVPGGAGDGALSYYYSIVEGDYPRALAYAENLVRALPNDATGYNFLAIALSYLNRSREAESAMNRAIELNPLGLVFLRNQARLLGRHHRLDEAERAIARFFAAGGPVNDNAIADLRFWLAGKLPDSATPEIGPTHVIPARWHWRAGKFRETLTAVENDLGHVGDDSLRRHELLLLRVDSLRRLRRDKEAAEAAAEALVLAEQLQAVPEVGPSQKLGWLAAALVRCDRFDEAITTALRWVETTPEGARPRQVWHRQIQLAEIYAQAKRPRECVELLSSLLRVPCELSVPMLKVDPAWDNVREDPAFQALLADPKNSAPL